jgi:protein involved in polysaccharide export with SLBB domain
MVLHQHNQLERCIVGCHASPSLFTRVGARHGDRGWTPSRAAFPSPGGRASYVWLLCGLILFGCADLYPVAPPRELAPFVYRVGPGDILTVEVRNEPGLEQREVTVTPDGHISFPMVDGTIDVADSTISEIAQALRTELLVVIREPSVTVTLRESRSAQVQVLGEIAVQGRVPYREDLSLIDAIGEAGGPLWATAKVSSVHVVRGVLDDPVLFEINLKKLLTGRERDIHLEPGDIVVVPAKGVTRFARYIQQLLTPVSVAAGTATGITGSALGL